MCVSGVRLWQTARGGVWTRWEIGWGVEHGGWMGGRVGGREGDASRLGLASVSGFGFSGMHQGVASPLALDKQFIPPVH